MTTETANNNNIENIIHNKHDRARAELIDQTNKLIINDYIQYMKKYEGWSREDVEHFLAKDPFAEIPESFSQSYYADPGFVLHTSFREDEKKS